MDEKTRESAVEKADAGLQSDLAVLIEKEETPAPAVKSERKAIRFSDSQQKVIDSRGRSLLVSASAGAGKTAVLVERLCRLVVDDRVPIASIAAMTFTEDAAREMKTRLRARLMEAAENDPWMNEQISALETASISTIHSFCLDLIQKYYYVANLSYSMVCHVDNDLADAQALEEAYTQAKLALDPQAAGELLLYMEAFSKNECHLRARLLRFLELARSKPDPNAWMESCRHTSPEVKAYFFAYYSCRVLALREIFEQMAAAIEGMEFARQNKQDEYRRLFAGKIEALRLCEDALSAGEYEQFAKSFISYIETTGKFTPTINKQSFKSIQGDSRRLEKEIVEMLYTRSQFEACEASTNRVRNTFIDLAMDVARRFAEVKKEAGFIDFADMELYAWQILQDQETRELLRKQYEVILIDEYQDTNDLQEAIISAIAREDNVFRVGDIKQSIYGFRQARPQLMKAHMDHPHEKEEVIAMQENYRSSAGLIEFSNDFFSRLMNVPGLPAQFGLMDAAIAGTPAQHEPPQFPVRFLYTEYGNWKPEDAGEGSFSAANAKRIHRRHRYDLIAHDIAQKVAGGQIALRDVAILTRTSTPHDELKKALESWGMRAIHHVRKGFYTNKAIQVVLSALRVIEDERNDIALMAVLASPLTGLSQDDILPLLEGSDSSQSLYNRLRLSSKGYPVLQIVRDLKALKTLSLPEMVVSIFGMRGFYDYQTSSQDKTNLDLLLEKAVEASHMLDLQGFLESATLEENLDKTSEATPFGLEEDAIRISTIHASKGLQYKVVYILSEQQQRDLEGLSPIQFDADLGLAFEGLDPIHMFKQNGAPILALGHKRFMEEMQEKMRLLYVACTRAEQELVFVDALKSENEYDWPFDMHALLNNHGFTSWFFHMYHAPKSESLDFSEPEALPAYRPQVKFEKVETLYDRPDRGVDPGRRLKIRRYRQSSEEVFSQTASQAKQSVKWQAGGYGKGLESGAAKERGTLFHEIVARLPYPYQASDIDAYARAAGMPLTQSDQSEILALNDNALYAKWMALPHEFECPYCVMDQGAIVHGYMDLVVDSKDAIEIIDFKSDSAFDEGSLAARYSSQLETYRSAMRQIDPNRPVRAWICSFSLNSIFELKEKTEDEKSSH